MRIPPLCTCLIIHLTAVVALGSTGALRDRVEHGFADSNGIKIHYVSIGQGPLVVMIHGFPDFWYSWRHQMEALEDRFQVVAIDQRGYNKSGQPQGVEAYDMSLLVSDVAAVIRHLGKEKAVIVGHDWGGAVAWQFALNLPEMTDKLVILNLPHPNGLGRELASNKVQQKNSSYARKFQQGSASDPDILFGRPMNARTLAFWVRDEEARAFYVEAFERSSFEGMLNYYKQNYPRASRKGDKVAAAFTPSKARMPVLMFHGLKDKALHSDGLNNTWDWLEKDLTLVTVPDAGHFVQQDAAELVSTTMKWWLLARQ